MEMTTREYLPCVMVDTAKAFLPKEEYELYCSFAKELKQPTFNFNPSRRQDIHSSCTTCGDDIVLPYSLRDNIDTSHYCKNCDPSTLQDEYVWVEELKMWRYVISNFKCEICSSKIVTNGNHKHILDMFCFFCDPSTVKKKYKWNKEEKRWYIDYYVYSCPECKKEIKSNITLDGEDLEIACKDCDPSDGIHIYKWNEKHECWNLDYTILDCSLCYKELRVRDIYPRIKIDINNDNGDLWPPSKKEIVHRYNCLGISSDRDGFVYVQELTVKNGSNKIKVYKSI